MGYVPDLTRLCRNKMRRYLPNKSLGNDAAHKVNIVLVKLLIVNKFLSIVLFEGRVLYYQETIGCECGKEGEFHNDDLP